MLEQQAIARRRALLEAMMQQNMQTPITGNTGLGQALAKMGTSYILGQKGMGLDQAEDAAKGRYGTELSSAVDQYLRTREGTPGATLSDQQAADLMQNDQMPVGGLPDPVAGNPRKAVLEAMASRFPEMQAIGKAELGGLLKKPSYTDKEVDGKLVRVFDSGQTQVLGDFKSKDQWEAAPDIVVDGKTVKVQRNKTTGELKSLATGQIINVNNSAENKGEAAVLTTTVEQISPKGKSYEGAQAADANLRATAEALGAIKQGADMGVLADFGQVLRKVGERLGIANAATVPTDQLSSVLKERVFHKLGGLGVAISDADRKFMQEAAGDISKDPVAMKRLLALDAAASMKELARHNQRVKQLVDRGGAYELLQSNAFPLNFQAPDDEFAQMIDNVFAGKPTAEGLPSALPKPEVKAPVSGGKPVTVRNW
ncbi:MAG: hypothetical protein AB7U98_13600 [Candidatus Nitrosocosmicus sp.]